MSKKRVVVTGMGVVSPVGTDLQSFWQAALQGKSGIKTIDHFDIPNDSSRIAGIIENYEPESALVFNQYKGEDRTIIFALEAIEQAVKQAKLKIEERQNTGAICSLVLSSAVAAISSMERYFNYATEGGLKNIAKSNTVPAKPYFKFNYITDFIANQLKINGRALLLPTGCAGCLDALAYSTTIIRDGLSDIVVTGASEAPITPLVVAAFNRIGATARKFNHIPSKASRPFDKDRDGFVLAEGCGVLILESLEHAQKRGATIYAEITGIGSVNNCFHMTNIPEDGKAIANSCQLALKDAGIIATEIDHINAHGSSTLQNDIAETNAFKSLFKERYKDVTITSNKSFLGHALAASNALESILAIQTINYSTVPPTINLDNQDERCDLNIVGNVAKKQYVNKVLKNSSGFSGIHTSLVIEKYKGT